MPITMRMQRMLRRDILYTALSRAKKQVILYGDVQALDNAMQTIPPERQSMLATKVNMKMMRDSQRKILDQV